MSKIKMKIPKKAWLVVKRSGKIEEIFMTKYMAQLSSLVDNGYVHIIPVKISPIITKSKKK